MWPNITLLIRYKPELDLWLFVYLDIYINFHLIEHFLLVQLHQFYQSDLNTYIYIALFIGSLVSSTLGIISIDDTLLSSIYEYQKMISIYLKYTDKLELSSLFIKNPLVKFTTLEYYS